MRRIIKEKSGKTGFFFCVCGTISIELSVSACTGKQCSGTDSHTLYVTIKTRLNKEDDIVKKESIDFSAIGAMLCGRELDERQKDEVKKLKKEYDEATKKRIRTPGNEESK